MLFPPVFRAISARRRGVPSPALVLAFVALLGAGATQVAWASGLLTGDDIKNGSLTGKYIKDGSIGPSDISRTGRAALQGTVGAKGETGAAGPAGAVGPAGPA